MCDHDDDEQLIDSVPMSGELVCDAEPDDLNLNNSYSSNSHSDFGSDGHLNINHRRHQWVLNHQEASIYLEEGRDNDKFSTHPQSREARPAYQMAHNHCFYSLELGAAVTVMLLAACERPAVDQLELPVGIHGSVEMLCLLILSLELGIRFKWQGWRVFFRHKRTVIKSFVTLLMIVEAVVVLVRQANHFRVTRALRPLFLIHTHYCQSVRRIIRQIMQSLPPIIDMILLLLFFMLIFSILGFYLFSPIKGYDSFKTLKDSFISLFVLLTTANYPDVMMPAYNANHLFSLFFIVYLSLELYFLMNLLLAVVYDTFSNLEKKKLQSLFFHKREGCMNAFRLLVTTTDPSHVSVKHFIGMMEFYQPKRTRREYYLMFKSLNTSKTGMLTIGEFFNVYNVVHYKWKLKNESNIWSANFKYPCNLVFRAIHWFAVWPPFDYFIYVIIFGNFVWILVETIRISSESVGIANYNFTASGISIGFVCAYCIEAVIKILGRGPQDYFTKGWDIFDFLVTIISVVGVFGEIFEDSFYYVTVLRPFRLLRLFKIKQRYRDVLGTFFVLLTRLTSIAICMIFVYYFFAIIGMEAFSVYDLRNCCKNSSVETYYSYGINITNTGYYYLNSFENLFVSGVTLFELTVINNWFIIMDGYAIAVSEWTRIYFMLFYLVMMVVMNIVVAFVLEAFMFRINYRRQMNLDDIDDHHVVREEIALNQREVNMVGVLNAPLSGEFINTIDEFDESQMFVGERTRNREELNLLMFQDEVRQWEREFASSRLRSYTHR